MEIKDYFCPNRVQHYHDYLQRSLPGNVFIKYRRAYIRNISYSFQYLEYLSHTFKDISTHVVIKNQLYKTFIITGCSIVESILWILLKGNKMNKKIQWKELQKSETNKFKSGESEFKFEIIYSQKMKKSKDIEMKFIDMCKSTEKRKLLGIKSDAYSKLNHLRKLRNRVHIHSVQHDRDNDYWVFEDKDINLMKEVLVSILKSNIFEPYPKYNELFNWLNI